MPRVFVFFIPSILWGNCISQLDLQIIYFHPPATMRWRGVGLQGWGVHPWLHEVRIHPRLIGTFCHIHPSSTLWIWDNLKDRPTSYSLWCWYLQMWRKHPVQRPQRRGPLQPMSGGKTLSRGVGGGVVNVLSQSLFFFVPQWFYSHALSTRG